MMRHIVKLAVVFVVALQFLPSEPAYAHTHIAADGTVVTWYPRACCDEQDCRSVKHELVYDISGTISHVRMLVAGEWETYPVSWTKFSRDQLAHWCGLITSSAAARLATMRCIFVPLGHASLPTGRSDAAAR